MIEASPKVSNECPPLKIRIFPNITSLLSLDSYQISLTSLSSPQSPKTETIISCSCQCPHVLIADDDPFQEFYYQNLFLKSMEFNGIAIEKEDFRIEICRSGEELLEKYQKINSCTCDSTMLIITDFNMGNDKLNGIETVLALRKRDYKGLIALRTSETEEDLCAWHPEFASLLENDVINCFLDKADYKKTREATESLLRKASVKAKRRSSVS